MQRATYKKHISQARYSSLNISIDPDWLDFDNFFNDMYRSYTTHVKKFGETLTTLDRVDNSKGYNKVNCKWKTPQEQARNRRSNIVFSIDGKERCLMELVEKTDLSYATVWSRVKRGWDISRALNEPLSKRRLTK